MSDDGFNIMTGEYERGYPMGPRGWEPVMPETDTYRELAARLGMDWRFTTIHEGLTVAERGELGTVEYQGACEGSVRFQEVHAIIRDRAAEALREAGHFVWEDELGWWTEGEEAAQHLDGVTAYPTALLAALTLANIDARKETP